MSLLSLIPAGVKAVQTGYDAYQSKKNKPKLAEHTFAGKEMAKIAETGSISPEARARTLQNVGSTMGAQAQRARTTATASLSPEMRGSVATQKLLSQPDRDVGEGLRRTSSDIELRNEESKVSAAMQLAQMKDESRESRRAWRDNFYARLAGGAGETVGLGIEGHFQGKLNDMIEEAMPLVNDMLANEDYDGAEAVILKLLLQQKQGLGSMR